MSNRFDIERRFGRSYLVFFDENEGRKYILAECIYGDQEKRHGDMKGWLKYVRDRTQKRVSNLDEKIPELVSEQEWLKSLLHRIEIEVFDDHRNRSLMNGERTKSSVGE